MFRGLLFCRREAEAKMSAGGDNASRCHSGFGSVMG